MAIDNVMLGVLNAYFRAAAEAAGHTLKRSAYTTYIKESNDFTTGLLTPRGEHFAYPVALAAQTYVGIRYKRFIDSLAPWSEGDVAVSNCPYSTFGVATHLADYHLLKPVFWEGRIVSFVWCFIHSSDMGGIVAGSILPSAYELFQEGIRIPPKKLYRAGELQEDVRDFMLSNVRQPDKNWGDLNAMLACLGTAEQRIHDAIGKWGVDLVVEGQEALIDYAERRARALIDTIPDGEWRFHDYLEDDVVSEMPVRVKVRVTKTPGALHIDYTGSDPQVGAAFNLASDGHHPFLCGAMYGYFRTMDPSIPVNGGLIRPIRFTAPEGSIVNATFPAACGVRFAVNQLNYGILQGILAQAVPGKIPAAGAAQASILAVSIMDSETGRRRANVIQPMIGGSGARPMGDGIDASDFSLGALANTPVESLESEVGVLVRKYALVPDSGGAGNWRGGLAARLDFEVLQPDTILTARGMDRFKFQPWGLDGGRAGAPGDCWLDPDGDQPNHVGKIDMMRLNLGTVFSVRTPGGGGLGDPLERDVERVADDVRNGRVSVQGAARDYGVVVGPHGVDIAATERTRQALRSEPAADAGARSSDWPACFDGGAGRAVHERVFSPEVQDTMVGLLYRLPAAARYYGKQRLYAAVAGRAKQDGHLSAEEVHEIWNELLPTLGLVVSDSA